MMTIFMKKFLQAVVQLLGDSRKSDGAEALTFHYCAYLRDLIVPEEARNPEQSAADNLR